MKPRDLEDKVFGTITNIITWRYMKHVGITSAAIVLLSFHLSFGKASEAQPSAYISQLRVMLMQCEVTKEDTGDSCQAIRNVIARELILERK